MMLMMMMMACAVEIKGLLMGNPSQSYGAYDGVWEIRPEMGPGCRSPLKLKVFEKIFIHHKW